MAALAGRYVTDTADFLAVTDEKSLIEATDDPRGPETQAESFDELEAAAVATPDGPEAEALSDILLVINTAVRSAEAIVEAFGAPRYIIPYFPADPTIQSLAVRWAWIDIQKRRGTMTTDDAERERDSIRGIGDRISDGRFALSSRLIGGGDLEAAEQGVYAYGGATRRFSQSKFDGPVGGNYRRGR